MTILIVIIGISILILVHEFGHFIVAKRMGLLVEEFGFGFPPRIWSKKIGETIYSFNALPFGGFVKIYGENPGEIGQTAPERSFSYQKAWKRLLIVVAGVVMNFILGWLLMSVIFLIGTPKVLLVSEVLKGSPAEAVGIKAQDQIVGFGSAKDFVDFVNKNRGKQLTLEVKRDSKELSFQATPRLQGEGALGVAINEAGIERHSFLGSFREGLKASVNISIAIILAFVNLFWGLITQGQVLVGIVGPVGIFGIANQAGQLGVLYVIQLIALISLNLAVLNIFPFPALDGGRFLFILIEKIKGSPLDPKFERVANAAGFTLLLILMVAVTIRDVVKLF